MSNLGTWWEHNNHLPLWHTSWWLKFWDISFFFFFLREFQLMTSVLDNRSLLLDQNINQFWCRRRLNPRSFIQLSEILPVELTETHYIPCRYRHRLEALARLRARKGADEHGDRRILDFFLRERERVSTYSVHSW